MFISWLNNEIDNTENILNGYYSSLEINTRSKITSGNIVELIRTAEVKLKTLESVKQMYQVMG